MTDCESIANLPVLDDPADLDRHGYPTDRALEKIKNWNPADPAGLMAYVKSMWYFVEWGWHEERQGSKMVYSISTGGWSGNEDLIRAMGNNYIFWHMNWLSSRRGGHFVFEVKVRKGQGKDD